MKIRGFLCSFSAILPSIRLGCLWVNSAPRPHFEDRSNILLCLMNRKPNIYITRYIRVATRRWRIKFMTYAIIMFEVWPPYVNRCECFDRGREIRAIDRISNMFRSKEFVEICSVHGPRFVFVSGLIFY